jgi:hypothetical protein
MPFKNRQEMERYWNRKAKHLLRNKTIVDVRYMTEKESNDSGWDQQGLVIVLENGVTLYPQRDDEGNGPGAIHAQLDEENYEILPTL